MSKRGRPGTLGPSIVISTRLPEDLYVELLARAKLAQQDLPDLIREALTEWAAVKRGTR